MGGELRGADHIDGQQDLAGGFLGLGDDLARRIGHLVLGQRAADVDPLGRQERIRHAAADDQRVDLADEVPQKVQLGRDLGPADNRHQGTLRRAKRGLQRLQFRLHQPSRGGRQQPGQCLGRGVRPVRRREGVVDIDLAQGRQGRREHRVVLLLAGMEPRILQQQDFTLRQRRSRLLGGPADAVFRKAHGHAQDALQLAPDLGKRHLGHRLALRASEMRHQHRLAAPVHDVAHRGHDPLDAGGVGHTAVLDRHVHVHADQHDLTGQFHVVECFPAHDRSPSDPCLPE